MNDSPVNKGQRPSRRARGRQVDGILLLDKPTGMTSNRVLQQVKRLFNANKAGHTGSLDPLASGMLPLCFGQATKASAWLLDADKSYEVVAAIGQRTDTADADGAVVETADKQSVSEAELQAAVDKFIGAIEQVPPMYSALRKDGRRLYELAREGKEVEREARPVHIYELEILQFDPQRPRLRVRCSKGTYVRTLVEDIALSMGTLAHVVALRRTEVQPFAGAEMVSLEQIEATAADAVALDQLLLPVDAALQAFPAVHLDSSAAFYLGNGHSVTASDRPEEGLVRLYNPDGALLGIGEVTDDGQVAPKRLFPAPLQRSDRQK